LVTVYHIYGFQVGSCQGPSQPEETGPEEKIGARFIGSHSCQWVATGGVASAGRRQYHNLKEEQLPFDSLCVRIRHPGPIDIAKANTIMAKYNGFPLRMLLLSLNLTCKSQYSSSVLFVVRIIV
jgi:hypothetical protein